MQDYTNKKQKNEHPPPLPQEGGELLHQKAKVQQTGKAMSKSPGLHLLKMRTTYKKNRNILKLLYASIFSFCM